MTNKFLVIFEVAIFSIIITSPFSNSKHLLASLSFTAKCLCFHPEYCGSQAFGSSGRFLFLHVTFIGQSNLD